MQLNMPVLETPRLWIRPFTLADLEAAHQVIDYTDGQETTSLEERRIWLEWTVRNYPALASMYQPPYGDRAIALKSTGEVVGACGLAPALGPFGLLPYFQDKVPADQAHRNLPEMGLYWALAEAHRGQGYATEAARALIDFTFAGLEMARIVATTEYANLPSQRVMQRLGMHLERNPHPEPFWFQVVGILENG